MDIGNYSLHCTRSCESSDVTSVADITKEKEVKANAEASRTSCNAVLGAPLKKNRQLAKTAEVLVGA